MSIFIRILLVVGAIVLLAFMLRKIRLAKLKIEYTVFWIGFSCILVIMGVFPQIMSAISEFLGFKSTVNMVYLIVIFVLIVKLFYNTIQISALENKVDSLAQQIAIDRKIDAEERRGIVVKDYLLCTLFYCVFTLLLIVFGNAINRKNKSISENLITGYLVYSFCVAIIGIPLQVLNVAMDSVLEFAWECYG